MHGQGIIPKMIPAQTAVMVENEEILVFFSPVFPPFDLSLVCRLRGLSHG